MILNVEGCEVCDLLNIDNCLCQVVLSYLFWILDYVGFFFYYCFLDFYMMMNCDGYLVQFFFDFVDFKCLQYYNQRFWVF